MGNYCKRLLSLLMVLFMVISMIPGNIFQVYAATGDAETDADLTGADLVINTAAELKAFAEAVNGGDTYSDKVVLLAADIDLEGSETNLWTPIGPSGDSGNKFRGTFDGQGHTIKNLYVKQNAAYHAAGLFGATCGTVKNLTIDGAYVESLSSGSATVNGTAVLAGSTAYGATIENVHVKNATVKGNRYVAGIVGYMDGSVIDCSVEDLTLIATPDDLTGSYDNGDKVGGIVGYCNSNAVEVSGCELKGTVSITAYRDVAGVVGCASTGVKINNNTNSAALTITVDQITNSYGEKTANASEFVGRTTPAEATGNTQAEGASCTITEAEAPSGTITPGYTRADGVWGEASANASESFYVELYVGDTKIATTQLNNIGGIIDGDVYVTWSIPFAGSTDAYWTVTWEEGYPDAAQQPTKVVLYCDGEAVAQNAVQMNAPDDLNPVVWEDVVNAATMPIQVTYADGSVEYFDDMLEAVPYKTNYPKLEGATVTLLKDISAPGIRMMENDMVLDLNGHTYTIIDGTGSQGTNTSGFQIRPEITTVATIKNGTIQVAEGAPVVWMFNVYATNFVVEDVTIDCANMAYSYGSSVYTHVSRSGDNTQFLGDTKFINFNSEVAGAAINVGGTMTIADTVVPGGSIELDADATLTAAEGLDVTTVDGYKVVCENGVYTSVEIAYVAQVGETKYETLQEALDAAAAGTGEVTVEILRDIDLTDVDWNPVTVSAPGYPVVTVNGNNKTITGLNDMLFAGTWAGGSGLIINDLTIKDSTIVNDENDAKGTVGVGAFIGYPQASATITLSNCHLVNSTVKGGHWTGGLIGMAGGYNGNDGPVFMDLTITGCSVTGSTITGAGSVGGVIGHGSCAAWTNVVIEDTTVTGNTITSTGSSNVKAGVVMGTIGAAGQETTAAGETKTGGAYVAVTESGNTVTSNGTAITTIYGRQGTSTGVLTVTGGSYENYPIEENVSYAAPAAGYLIQQGTDGTYVLAEDPAYGMVAKIGDTYYETLAEALEAAKAETDIVIDLVADASLDITAWQDLAIGGESTETITINGNGNTLTFNKKNSDWDHITTNNGAKLILNDMTITDSGYNDGPWNRYDLSFACPVELNNVTATKAIALKADAKLTDVTIDETGDNYAIWIQPNGQSVEIDGLTVTSAGRGIKIDNQYVDEAQKVTLSVSDATFTTNKKAAILVKSPAGADITLANVDISGVAADTVNAVWNDEDAAAYYGLITVTGGTKAQEGEFVATLSDKDGNIIAYYADLAEAFTAAQDGDEVVILSAGTYTLSTSGKDITITGAVDGVVFDNIGAKNMGGANVTFNNVTFDYYPNTNYTGLQHSGDLVYNNCTFNGQVFLYGTRETFNGCTFNQNSADAYNVWTYGAKQVTFEGCTFNCAGKSVLIYSEDGALYNDVSVTDCDFVASAPVEGKAAIEMDSSLTAGINLTIDGETTTTGFGTGNVSGNSLWNNKKDNKTEANNDITVTVDGNVVLQPMTAVAKIGNNQYYSLAEALEAAQAGETVMILAGEYDAFSVNKTITVVGETDAEGNNLVNLNGKLSVTGTGVTVKNLNVNNSSERAVYVSGGDILIEGCNLTGVHGLRYCYANNGDVTLKDCVITGSTYGVHFDAGNGEGNVIIDGCTITGWTSFGSAIEGVTITDTTFCDGNYDMLRFYQSATLEGCTFSPATTIDFGKNEVRADLNNCSVSDGSALTDVVYLGDIANMGVQVYEDGELIVVEAKIGDTYYLTLEEAVAAAQDGDTVIVLEDVSVADSLMIKSDITLDLGSKTVSAAESLTNKPVIRVLADVTVTGGTVDGTTGTNSYAFIVGNNGTAGTLNIADGTYKGVTSAVSITNGTANISGGTFSAAHDGEGTDYGAQYLLNCMDAAYKAGTAVYNITGGTFLGFNPENNAAEGAKTDFVTTEGYGVIYDGSSKYTVAKTPELPTATVTMHTADSLVSGNAPKLTFAMNFLADAATQEQLDYYGNWYADFVLTVNKKATFNADSVTADGYLAGQYDNYNTGWLAVPFEDVTLEAGQSLKIMEYAAELMGEPGLKFTYEMVYELVENFDCGIYFTPEFLAENPDLVVTLQLKMYNNADETVSEGISQLYTFTTPVAVIESENKAVYFETMDAALAAAQAGETIIMLTDAELSAAADKPGVTVDLNGFDLTGDVIATLDINGGTYTTTMYPMAGGEGFLYETTDAVIEMASMNEITVKSGTITLGQSWRTLAGQKLTIAADAAFVIPADTTMEVNCTVIADGTLTVDGEIQLTDPAASVKAAQGLNVTTELEDYLVEYIDGAYVLTELGDRVAQNTVTGVFYNDVAVALNEAVSGQTVILLTDVSTDSMLMVMDGITLDLNGNTLQVNNYLMAVFSNSYVIDSSEDNSGLLAISINKLRLLDTNPMLPIAVDGGYKFVEVELYQHWSSYGDFEFWFNSVDQLLLDQYAAGRTSEDMNISIQIEAVWDGGSQLFDFDESVVSAYIAKWDVNSLYLNIKGTENVTGLKYKARVVFGSGTMAEVVIALDDYVDHVYG